VTLAGLSGFLAEYGLVLLLPWAVIEGPIVSILAGVLCARGGLSWALVLPVLVLGDLIGDGLYYAAGRLTHSWLHRMAPRLGIPLARGEALAARVAARSTHMLLIGKWTHAIGALVLVAAGAARIGLARFMLVNLLATLPKSALLLGLGYLAGANAEGLADRFGLGVMALFGLGVLAAVLVLRRQAPGEAA